ncbi:MAG: DNA polymerase III subunit beta [Candidatus Paceibacterota bacterium]|nr:MAG: DNA polymerase III subunit beta [Candidatus Paceibacterota bacterium]
MKAHFSRDHFLRALSYVERTTAKAGALPILSYVLIRARPGKIECVGTNLEVGITATLGARVDEEGSVAVSGKVIHEFLHSIHDDVLELSVKDQKIIIKGKSARTTLLGVDAKDFPIIPNITEGKVSVLHSGDLQKLLQVTHDTMALSDARPELSGAYMRFTGKECIVAATDSFRLVEKRIPAQTNRETSVIIPRSAILEVSRIAGDLEGDVAIYIHEHQVAFVHDSCVCVTRVIDGVYPDYARVIPDRPQSKLLVQKGDFEQSIRLGGLFSSRISDILIRAEKDECIIQAKNTERGEVETKIPATIQGDGFLISANFRYVLDGIKVIDTDALVLEFTSPTSPIILKPTQEQGGTQYIIMPLRT